MENTQETQGSFIDTATDIGDLSLMLGFEDKFDVMGSEVEDIYQWAKETTGLPGGSEVLMFIKNIINDTNMTGVGKELTRKLHRWAALDSKIRDLKVSQMVIENG